MLYLHGNQTKPSRKPQPIGPIVRPIRSNPCFGCFPSVVSNHQTLIRSLDPFTEPQHPLPCLWRRRRSCCCCWFVFLSLFLECHSTPAAAARRAAAAVAACMSLIKWMQNLLTNGRPCVRPSLLASRRGAAAVCYDSPRALRTRRTGCRQPNSRSAVLNRNPKTAHTRHRRPLTS